MLLLINMFVRFVCVILWCCLVCVMLFCGCVVFTVFVCLCVIYGLTSLLCLSVLLKVCVVRGIWCMSVYALYVCFCLCVCVLCC